MSPVKSPEKLSARCIGEKDKIVVEKDEAEELPPGWTKEVKRRKTGSATKIDRYYTDPVTGYIFRSLKDAQRYLKTGELGRLAIKPKNNEGVDMDNKDERLHMEEREEKSESKEQMSDTLRRKRPLDKTRSKFSEAGKSELLHRASTRLAGINIESPTPSSPDPKTRQTTPSPTEPKTRKATRKVGIGIDSLPLSPPDTRTSRPSTRQAGITFDLPPPSSRDSKTGHVTPLVGTEFVPSQPEPKTRQAKRLSGIRENASPASLQQPKTRRATRQAGIKIDSPPPSPPDTRTSRQATRARLVNLATPKENDKETDTEKITDKQNENAAMDDNPNHNQETSNAIPPINQENNEKQELHSIFQPVVNPTVSNPIPQEGYGYVGAMKSDSSINFSMNDLWTDPCIEFAVKTLTGAIPFGDLNTHENFSPSPLQVPLEELWTDPCIEFAVKTLTGAIPVGGDDHLQQQSASSRNSRAPHDFYLPDVGMSFFQTGQNKQQDSTFGNGGLQRSGNVVNGQSSRSRFFQ